MNLIDSIVLCSTCIISGIHSSQKLVSPWIIYTVILLNILILAYTFSNSTTHCDRLVGYKSNAGNPLFN